MSVKMTVIVDNISDCGIKGEWGLCLLLETGGKKILVDTGGSSLFSENLKKLGFYIRDIDYGVLSHAHYDHANGMPKFFAENSKAKFYLREGSAENCYHRKRLAPRQFFPRAEPCHRNRKRTCDCQFLLPRRGGKHHKGNKRNLPSKAHLRLSRRLSSLQQKR